MENKQDTELDGLLDLARPLMEWLERNHHPHCTIILDSERAELVEGLRIVMRHKHKDCKSE